MRHKYVRKVRGPASDHACEMCGQQAAHWATIPLDYSVPHFHAPLTGYHALCARCHREYDTFITPADDVPESAPPRRARRFMADVTRGNRRFMADVRTVLIAEGKAAGEFVPSLWLAARIRERLPERYADRTEHAITCDLRSAMADVGSRQIVFGGERRRGYLAGDLLARAEEMNGSINEAVADVRYALIEGGVLREREAE